MLNEAVKQFMNVAGKTFKALVAKQFAKNAGNLGELRPKIAFRSLINWLKLLEIHKDVSANCK